MPDGSSKPLIACTAAELRAEAEMRKFKGEKLLKEAESLSDAADMVDEKGYVPPPGIWEPPQGT